MIDRGRIVEQGRHADVVRLGGLYATLYREQFSSGLVEARCQDGVALAGGEVVSVRAPGAGAARELAPA